MIQHLPPNSTIIDWVETICTTIPTLPDNLKVLKRSGDITAFDSKKIATAIIKAFVAVEGDSHSQARQELVTKITLMVTEALINRAPAGRPIHIEDIQDQVELGLMRCEQHKVARSYVLYREKHNEQRQLQQKLQRQRDQETKQILVSYEDGSSHPLDIQALRATIAEASRGLDGVDNEAIFQETLGNIYSGVSEKELSEAMVFSARAKVEIEPNYAFLAARLLLNFIWSKALKRIFNSSESADKFKDQFKQIPFKQAQFKEDQYIDYFPAYIHLAIQEGLLDPKLSEVFDLDRLARVLDSQCDFKFRLLGLQTLYDRYFQHVDGVRIELPQAFFMRVAMGLALSETNPNQKAEEFYRLLANFDFMCSTPTLFNSGTLRPQLSSCYLTTIGDDLDNIYESIKDNAMLSKYAGGLGNDWTAVRALGAHIKGTNGKSQGVVPFLKVVNDTAVAVNQGGKRKGAICAYLETWHLDIEQFLELRKTTGDDRRRAHDMNTANWVPDLFMKRVINDQHWTLFSPDDVPDLHDLYGEKFTQRYGAYEALAKENKIRHKKLRAVDLWHKMLGMLFETGHPWITFKDPCNLRSPQQHIGVVHSSNLCTEITLNTSKDEIAVCNLGSINLLQHIDNQGKLDVLKIEKTVSTAMRMLDNVIDYNYYSVAKAQKSNLRHRPVGMGIMGFQDSLYRLSIAYASDAAVEFADYSTELISYFAIKASTDLAEERGTYATYQGSLWSQGILPIDSIENLADSRGQEWLQQDRSHRLDWQSLRQRVMKVGMRNSNTMAIAPTATISNIIGVSQSIEPIFRNLYGKSNLSGDFTLINESLVRQLKQLNLWDEAMHMDLKFYDGSVQGIERIPERIKEIYQTAYEIDPAWLIASASRRQKWLDQAQSLNLYLATSNGKQLDQIYKLAWQSGLKTTYYLRTVAASSAEKSTVGKSELRGVQLQPTNGAFQACSIDDPDCEGCQ